MDKKERRDSIISKTKSAYFWSMYLAIAELVQEKGGSIDLNYLYYFIDGNNDEDVDRIKKVYWENDKLFIVADGWNQEDYIEDLTADIDEFWEGEDTYNLLEVLPSDYWLNLLNELYNHIEFISQDAEETPKKKKFTFRFHTHGWTDITVEAENEEEAQELADDKYNNGEYDDDASDFENTDCENITEE